MKGHIETKKAQAAISANVRGILKDKEEARLRLEDKKEKYREQTEREVKLKNLDLERPLKETEAYERKLASKSTHKNLQARIDQYREAEKVYRASVIANIRFQDQETYDKVKSSLKPLLDGDFVNPQRAAAKIESLEALTNIKPGRWTGATDTSKTKNTFLAAS